MNSLNTARDTDSEIGPRLRFVREQAGLSQRELAKRVGVPNSSISLMESGKTNPSVGSLKRVLDGIPIDLSEFFSFEPEPDRKVFFAAEELKEIGRGKLSLKQVGDNLLGRSLQMMWETYDLRADTGARMYEHDGEEGGIVVSGRIEITVGKERKILGAGDAYLFESRTPHRFRQVGTTPCVIVSACTPPTF